MLRQILQIFVRLKFLCGKGWGKCFKYLWGWNSCIVEANIANNCEAPIFVWLRLRQTLQIFVGRNCFVEFVRAENRGKYLVKESWRESWYAVMVLPSSCFAKFKSNPESAWLCLLFKFSLMLACLSQSQRLRHNSWVNRNISIRDPLNIYVSNIRILLLWWLGCAPHTNIHPLFSIWICIEMSPFCTKSLFGMFSVNIIINDHISFTKWWLCSWWWWWRWSLGR